LIEDAMERRFDVVLVFHTSRFARNTVEARRYKKLLRSELGIEVISVTQPLSADADDPAAFVSESVHEIFDEYYSVSLSFWTKMGLREKARQCKLTGSLPWGYVKGEEGIAVPDPIKAPFVRRLYEMYASGQHTDRTLAEWLNNNEQRTARDRSFGVDTVREMLCNAAYAGYVLGRRDKSKAITGLHEPIVDEPLYDRVQDMRRERAHTKARQLSPGPLPDLDQAGKVLEDFSIFRTREIDPAAKRQLLALIFERMWLDEQRVTAVQPKPPSAPYFNPSRKKRPFRGCVKSGSDGTRTRDLCRDRAAL
jgi:DNA invertase Pin-like site-specific DNA recombinase